MLFRSSGIRFVLPSTVESSNFNAVTVEYKDSMNVGDGFGNGIWGNDKETEETVTKWSGLFVPTVDEETEEEINFGTVTFNLPADADSWYIKNCLLFCNDETVMSAATPATVTITKVTFWNTEYDASEEPGTGGEEGDYTSLSLSLSLSLSQVVMIII